MAAGARWPGGQLFNSGQGRIYESFLDTWQISKFQADARSCLKNSALHAWPGLQVSIFGLKGSTQSNRKVLKQSEERVLNDVDPSNTVVAQE